jgi:predicted DsbA family dithiol-disulfide isomerase
VRIEKLKNTHGLNIKFTHFPLHPDTPVEGKPRAANPERDRRMKALMEQEGLPYKSDRDMTYNSRRAQEFAKWAEGKGKGYEINDPLFRAFFVEAKNIGDPQVLSDIAQRVGLPVDEAIDALLARSFKPAVDDDWRRCAELGVSAVPTFLIGPSTSLRAGRHRYALVGAHPYEELEKLVARARG